MKNRLNIFYNLDKTLVVSILIILIFSIPINWSAINCNIDMMKNKVFHIFIGIFLMIFLSYLPSKWYEKLSYFFYFFSLVLLFLSFIFGDYINGSNRWLNFKYFKFQPSELQKISLPIMISKILEKSEEKIYLFKLIFSFFLIILPTILISLQPDLGTSIITFISTLTIFFFIGIKLRYIIFFFFIIVLFFPVIWFFFMKEYQKLRIMLLINPNIDPLGSGYHVIQSKIAIGSGGLFGKGWMNGNQSHLQFLPEHHTDFIFSLLSEEFGFFGVVFLLSIYMIIILRCIYIGIKIDCKFKFLFIESSVFCFFIYIFINISMVSGLLPVVGIPLPLLSYGGSNLISTMATFGIIMSMYSSRKKKYLKYE